LSPDRTIVASSKHPVAVNVGLVGSYPALTKSGAGYFYDDVLEYRVWMKPAGGGDSFFRAFASYETALQFSKSTPRSEEPLVLIRQVQWINEPEPGVFQAGSGERITEWKVGWLSGSKRSKDRIERFLKEHQKPQ
jgi:putative acetyltransferase